MKILTRLALVMALVAACQTGWGQTYSVASVYESGETGTVKAFWPAYVQDRLPILRYFKTSNFEESTKVVVSNGYTGDLHYTAESRWVPGGGYVITNATGSFTYSDDDGKTANGNVTLPEGWTVIIYTNGTPSDTNVYGIDRDTQGLDWDCSESSSACDFNMNLWAPGGFVTYWHEGQITTTVSATVSDTVLTVNPGDLGPGDTTQATSEGKMTLSDEFRADDLIAPFYTSGGWASGFGSAGSVIGDDQTSLYVTGSRNKFLINWPAGKKFSVQYVTEISLDGMSNSAVMVMATNIFVTNTLSGVGLGFPTYYPSGDGIAVQPPLSKLSANGDSYYCGGSAILTLGAWTYMGDSQDKSKGDAPCDCCRPVNAGPGMPQWWISEPYIDLWVQDIPVDYVTTLGEKIGFKINYKQHDTRPTTINGQAPFLAINGWNNNWYSYVHFTAGVVNDGDDKFLGYDLSQWTAVVYEPSGGETSYDYKLASSAKSMGKFFGLREPS